MSTQEASRARINAARLLSSCLFITSSLATLTSQFQNFYPQHGGKYEYLLQNNCSEEFANYLTGRPQDFEGDWLGGAGANTVLVQPVVTCLLDNVSEYIKAASSSAQVILGVAPPLLATIGSSTDELAMLSVVGRRPLLSLLISFANPSVYMERIFDFRQPEKMLQNSRGRYTPQKPSTAAQHWALVVIQYAVALGAAANIAVMSWQLGVGTVCSWWSETVFAPLVWTVLSIPIHLAGTFATRLRLRRIYRDEDKKMNIGFGLWMQMLPTRLYEFCWSEWVPSVSQDEIRVVSFNEERLYVVWSWLLSTATIIHILYVVSVLACRILVTFELAGMRASYKAEPEAIEEQDDKFARYRRRAYEQNEIDHFPHNSRYVPHAKGTFKQRYFVETSYYKPDGPVFLYLGGEGSIDGDTHLDASLIEQFVKRFNGIGVVLENRYYGTSFPFNTSTTDELLYLTTEQVIADFDLFARKAKLPGVGNNIHAPSTPWILYGGSYPGALSAFTIKRYPKTFYAAISSSGVIHGQLEYPQWYDPIQKLAPQDCVTSVNDIIDKMDLLVQSNNRAAIQELKEIFGLGALEDIRDFAQTIAFPIGGPFYYKSYTWQEINWNPQFGSQAFFRVL
ncbi:hypothetical protein NUW58_g182 [Xylaria curta]|uniref:Uncharacterized protein n=1 Tax=Xylaria curta TaxID=42375 RepID=A0ACC1PSW8_9PEZI|nr:hypothetical protein NUW58_g182 [Xylaria curta]